MNRKISACLLAALLLAAEASPAVQLAGEEQETEVVKNQWKGKRVAFLGDSITDKQHLGTTKCYWEYLAELLGLEAFSYGINGNQMDGLLAQAERLYREQADDVDAIIIFGGTNDYNGGVPLGEWYEEVWRNVPLPDGKVGSRRYRKPAMDAETFRGRINRLMDYLKTHFPTKQIIVLTPLHRGFAQFSAGNVQPEEAYPNRIGIYVDEYVQALKEAGNV